MDLPYFAADTLGVTLYQTQQGKLVANEVHQLSFGSWRLELPITVDSDIILPSEMGFWVTMAELSLYLVVRSKETWLFALDKTAMNDCEAQTRFEAKGIKARIEEFKPAIRGVFRWSDGWKKVGDGVTVGE